MSESPEVHYEVSVLDRNGDWEVVDIQQDEIAARATAKALLAKGGIAGVRVAMETFDSDTQRFHGRMLWETQVQRTRRPAAGYHPAKAAGAGGTALPVNNVREFKPAGRRQVQARPSWWRRLLGLGPSA